jgi:hypothetical protein
LLDGRLPTQRRRGRGQTTARSTSGPSGGRAIKAVNTLCGGLREHSRLLVDAFAMPESALGDARAVAAAAVDRVPA